jgi:hypothetical protein
VLKPQTKTSNTVCESNTEKSQPILQATSELAKKLFPHNRKKRQIFLTGIQEMYAAASHKDVLIIHSPGGWGNTRWDGLLEWEKSIVTGVTATLEELGYTCIMKQYFRCGDKLWGRKSWIKEGQFFLFGRNNRAEVLAAELNLITANLPQLRVVLVGASQGAAFDNMVMMKSNNMERLYSIELGTFFGHMRRRQLTNKNLAIDSNGMMRDPMCHRDLWKGTKSYFKAFVRWFNYKAQGKPVKFTHCINTPGHEYQWEYPEVKGQITQFLTAVFGEKH